MFVLYKCVCIYILSKALNTFEIRAMKQDFINKIVLYNFYLHYITLHFMKFKDNFWFVFMLFLGYIMSYHDYVN